MTIKTIKIKSTDEKSQGKFVVINESEFDKEKHELIEVKPRKPRSPNKPKPPVEEAVQTQAGLKAKQQTGSGDK